MSLAWTDETRDLGANGRSVTRTATPEERARVAEALDILSCNRLVFEYTLKPIPDHRYRLKGSLSADVTQACVVTLESVSSTIDEDVVLEFWPAHLLSELPESGERDILGDADPEPLGQLGRIDSGRVAFEVLSAALDPYPRAEGAEFEDIRPVGERAAIERDHPFAALAKFKNDKPKD